MNNGRWGNCLQKLWSRNATNISTCTFFSWNIDYPTTKTLEQWVRDQYQGNQDLIDLIYSSDGPGIGTAATNEYIFAQIYVDADYMPMISKSTYRRIGEHHFQWRFDPFFVSDRIKRIIVRYKRKTTCLHPYYFVLQTFEESLFVESCSRFQLLFGGYATSLRTLEEFPLPVIPPINESDYEPIKKEDIPIFNPKGYNESEFSTIAMPKEITYSTAMPTGMSYSITVSKEMPQPTTVPKKVSHSTTVPKEVSHSTTVSTDSTTVPSAISNTVPTGMSHPPTIMPTGMPPSSQDQSQVASAGITSPWLWLEKQMLEKYSKDNHYGFNWSLQTGNNIPLPYVCQIRACGSEFISGMSLAEDLLADVEEDGDEDMEDIMPKEEEDNE
uniref:Uncharacterized protein n=1 Tax=Panagrolaimus davidi TaxID=227884 RepID=A0A914P7Y6_9BILA